MVPAYSADDGAGQSAARALERIRRGIGFITGGTRRPPGFTREALVQLKHIATVVAHPDVSELAFWADRESVRITEAMLSNLRLLLEP